MKKLSHWNLLHSRVSGERISFIKFLFQPSELPLKIILNRYDYIKGDHLVQDVNDMLDEGDSEFTYNQLMQLLYEDILLLSLEKPIYQLAEWFVKTKRYQEQTDIYILGEQLKQNKPGTINVEVPLSRSMIERGEALVDDMLNKHSGFCLTLEEITAIRYTQCIREVHENKPAIIKNLLSRLSS